MRTINQAVEVLGVEKVYEIYTEYMNTVNNGSNTHQFIITSKEEYIDDLIVDNPSAYILDQYAVDGHEEYNTFEECFNEITKSIDARKDLEKAIQLYSFKTDNN